MSNAFSFALTIFMVLGLGIAGVNATGVVIDGGISIDGENVSLKNLDVRGALNIREGGNLTADENVIASKISLESQYEGPMSGLRATNVTTQQLSNERSRVEAQRLKTEGFYAGSDAKANIAEANISVTDIEGGSDIRGGNWTTRQIGVDTGAVFTAKNLTSGPTRIETGAVVTADNATLGNTSMCCGAVLRSMTGGSITTQNLDSCCGAEVRAGEYHGKNVELSAGAQITAERTVEARDINLTYGGAVVAPNIDAEEQIVARHLSVSGDRVVASG